MSLHCGWQVAGREGGGQREKGSTCKWMEVRAGEASVERVGGKDGSADFVFENLLGFVVVED